MKKQQRHCLKFLALMVSFSLLLGNIAPLGTMSLAAAEMIEGETVEEVMITEEIEQEETPQPVEEVEKEEKEPEITETPQPVVETEEEKKDPEITETPKTEETGTDGNESADEADESEKNADSAEEVQEPEIMETEEPVEEVQEEAITISTFTIGYLRVKKDTIAYTGKDKAERKGRFYSESIVYAQRVNENWFFVNFDTQQARDARTEILGAYVHLDNVALLTEEEAESAKKAMSEDVESRSLSGVLIPRAAFEAETPLSEETKEETESEETLPTEENTDHSEEEVVPATQADSTLEAPAGVTVKALSAESAKITWETVAGANGYRVYRSVDGGAFSFLKNSETNETITYGLKAGVEYRFKIAAYEEQNGTKINGPFSEEVVLLITVPAAPKELRAEQLTSMSVKLTWSEVEGATGYRLYRAVNDGDFTIVKTLYTDATTTANYGLVFKNNSYRYKIAAIIEVKEADEEESVIFRGDCSPEVEITKGQLDTPKNLVAIKNGKNVDLSWDEVNGATGYRLYRSENGGQFSLVKTVTTTKTTNYNLNFEQTQYAYKVAAIADINNVIKKSLDTAAVSVTEKIALAAPANLKVEQLSSSILKLSWDAVEGAAAYRLYRSISGGEYQLVKTIKETTTANYGINLSENEYAYRVAAIKGEDAAADKSDYSEEVRIAGQLSTPQKLTVTANGNTIIQLNWSAVEEATSYRLYRSVNGETFQLIKTVTGTETKNYNLDLANNTYVFRVVALASDEKGIVIRKSDASDNVAFGITLSAPQNLIVTKANSNSVKLTWDAVEGATGYQIYRSVNGGKYGFIKSVTTTETNNYNLDFTTNYYSFKVKAIYTLSTNVSISSDFSEASTLSQMTIELIGDSNFYVGDTATWKAVASEGVAPYQYSFVLTKDGVKVAEQTYSDSDSFEYTFTEKGDYTLKVNAKDQTGGTASSQALQLSVSEGTFGDFQYKINDEGNGIVITHYLGNAASVEVPEQINQLPVVTIGASAFEGNTILTSINLPDTVQVIGERAFANCTNLSEMN